MIFDVMTVTNCYPQLNVSQVIKRMLLNDVFVRDVILALSENFATI